MKRAGIRELKANFGAFLDDVRSGETIEVVDGGLVVARLIPGDATNDDTTLQAVRDGRVVWSGRRPRLPEPIVLGGTPLAEIVTVDRGPHD